MSKRIKTAKRDHPTREKRDYVVIAGSGPSVLDYDGHVDVATKKMSAPADYQFARHQAWYYKVLEENVTAREKGRKPRWLQPRIGFILYRNYETPNNKYPVEKIHNRYVADWKYWDSYFKSFRPNNQNKKPSVGCCAVMAVMEMWSPEKVGLIGFDWVLDGNKDWLHDSRAELECILSLADVEDLRTGKVLDKKT